MTLLFNSFYERPARIVARELLGKVLVRREPGILLRGRIVETEAYEGRSDPGSHAFRGPTPRTAVMFGPPGHIYVYRSYGVHWCVNVVTDPDGMAGAVLLRALEPLDGLTTMRARRGSERIGELCSGPGKLCQAFGITSDQNGQNLADGPVQIEDDAARISGIVVSSRIGLTVGKDAELRFFLAGNSFVSRGMPSGKSIKLGN